MCTLSRMRRITRAGKTGPRYINCYGAPIRDKKTRTWQEHVAAPVVETREIEKNGGGGYR